MKKFIIIILLGLFTTSCSSDEDNKNFVENSLTQIEIDDLHFLREEEKLARDVYLFSYNLYGNAIFNNISKSEQNHMDQILVLLNTYNLDDPALPNKGEFKNQLLQGLYNDLTAQSAISLVEALKVGATIEDLDISDIDEFEDRTDVTAILNTYDKLKCGSRNHMRNYYGQLLNNDVWYSPQYISISELEEIMTTENEKCGN